MSSANNLFSKDQPTGYGYPFLLPEVTMVKVSEAAAKAGVSVPKALSDALAEYCAKHGVK